MEGSNPGNFFEFGGRLYFAATDPVVGREPHYLDLGILNTTSQPNNNLSLTKQPFPNPLSNKMPLTAEINLVSGTKVYAQLYDPLGRAVKGIQDLGYYPAGKHALQIQLDDYPGGMYYLTLTGGEESHSSALIILE
jgi:hypothetical protein